MEVPEVAGLDGAWLEPTIRSAAARRLVYSGAPGALDVWTQPFRVMRGLATTGRIVASGAALELPLAAWTLAGGADGGGSAEWTVEFGRAWPEDTAPVTELESRLSADRTRLLVTAAGGTTRALFACRGGRISAETQTQGIRVRCEGRDGLTLAAIGAVDRADLDRTLDLLARRGLGGLARQRLQHDEQVARGGAAATQKGDGDAGADAALRFDAARLEADAALAELPGVGRAPLLRLADDARGRPGVFRIRDAVRTAHGLLAAGLREPARDTLRFVAHFVERGGAVPSEVSLGGIAAGGDAPDARAFAHLADRHFAWTGDAALRDELAESVARAGSDSRDPPSPGVPASAGDLLLATIESDWGVDPDAPGGTVRLRPRLAARVHRAGLSRLRIGRTIFDLRLRRRGATAQLSVRKVMGPPLVVDCELPGVAADAVELDGVALGTARVRFEATGEHELIVHAAG